MNDKKASAEQIFPMNNLEKDRRRKESGDEDR
jgi:hypothetical protein